MPTEIDGLSADWIGLDMKAVNIQPWRWVQGHAMKGFPGVPVSSDHRLLWGWIRLVLGLTQMAFTATACLLIFHGFYGRAVVAIALATAATVISRYLFAGRPDPRLEDSLNGGTSIEQNGRGERLGGGR